MASFLKSSWMMMDICGTPFCSKQAVASCGWKDIFDSSTCTNHILEMGISTLIIIILALQLLVRVTRSRASARQQLVALSSPLQLAAVVFNGCLGLIYLGLALWMLGRNFSQHASVHLPHWWMVTLSQGFCLILISFAFSIRTHFLGPIFIRVWSVLLTIYAGFICCSSVVHMVADKVLTMKACLDVLFLPGALLLLFHGIWHVREDGDGGTESALYKPLNTEIVDDERADSQSHVTPFAKAGFFSVMAFWWLNPMMKMGYEKPLEEKDMPLLGPSDRAYSQYMMFLEKLNRKKQLQAHGNPSIFWTIISCQKSGILVSGLFALLKVLTLSSGPLLLKAFINVSLGKGSFKYEGYVLAVTMFICKCGESLSQRQWYFRTRRLGLQVRSFLSAAIYKKQQKLSNSAKLKHSSGEIMNYVTVDAYRIGEFPYWFHQTWTTGVQLCIALVILYSAVGLATIASLGVIIITVACNAPLAKLQHKFQSKLMGAQDVRLKAMSESLIHMKVLKLYAWETHFKKVIEGLREIEIKWLSAFQLRKAYNSFLFWTSPILVSAATFLACYLLKIPLDASNVFTFVATLRLVQDPIRQIPDVIGVVIQAKVAFTRITKFLDAPEMNGQVRKKYCVGDEYPIVMNSCSFSWDENPSKPTLKNINLVVKAGQKVAICGEVGSGKSTLLAAVLGEVPKTEGTIQVCGKIAYVSQNAWIQTGTVQDNILFGSSMDRQRYQETLERCSLVKDLEMLPYGDRTQIGERGVNLSGGQKQRVQLARALYQNADIYLLDDPFSAVDAHTATSLFNEYVMGALSDKTVLLVTHQVDFLPVFDSILLMSDGEIIRSASYHDLLAYCQEFQNLVNAHKDTIGVSDLNRVPTHRANEISIKETIDIRGSRYRESAKPSPTDQLIKTEEREMGDTGFKPYILYLRQNRGFFYASLGIICHIVFVCGQISQNSWMAANVENPDVSTLKLTSVYIAIGIFTVFFLLFRSLAVVVLGVKTSRSLFSQLLNSLFRAPMSFYDSTPLGRVLSRVSSDLSIVDLDIPFAFMFSASAGINAYSNLGVLAQASSSSAPAIKRQRLGLLTRWDSLAATAMLCLVSPSSSPTPLPPPRRSRSPADRAAPPGIAGGGNVRLSVLSVQCEARLPGVRKVKSKFATAATVQEDKTMATAKGNVDHLPIYDLDPKLEKFKDHFSYRMKRYLDQKGSIEENEGNLEEFSKGYLKFGINTNEDGTVYREWAPAAQEAELIGDFNDWNGANHKMEKDKFGVWSIKIDHVKGKPAIPHNSKVKFRFLHGGVWVDRIPAWIRYATVDASKFGAPYDGVHWDPPASERYTFKHPRPSKPAAPRIYEAHVGMSGEKPAVSTYREFADNVLPRIRANNYNTVQLMAVMEHSYYASFGYHVTNFFAVSSRSGTPEDLKYLVDKAHSLGLRVLMDVVHSHASNNVTDGLNGYDVGQSTQESYFHTGDRGYHKLWDSRLFNYANWEVLRFLLSNLRYWLDEFMFDGFRFDGVTSMLYHHHGINVGFTGNYQEYFGLDTDVDAVVYMMLANHLMHKLLPEATVVAEDVSGMPVLCRPVDEGGVGFDYRLAMAIPDRWIDYLKNKDDSEWSMGEIAHTLTNRRYTEKCIAYAESHDQSIVGDKTIAFLLMDKEMYTGMSDLQPASPTIDRGIALQKMIHFITMALGGDGYLNFMGNEFGHPEWIDFPREGNNWSYDKCRRQWSLVDTDHLRYKYMNAFDQAMNALDERFSFLSSSKQIVSDMNDEKKVVVFERGDLVFVFNFHPKKTYEGYKVGCDLPGKYRVALDSDALVFGGHGRVGHDVDHFTSPEGIPGVPETNFNNRPNSFKVLSPPRTCVAYYRVDEEAERLKAKAETTSSRKTSPEIIDVDATPVKTSTATKEDKEAAFGGKKDDSSKKGWKFARQSSNKNTK